MRKTSSRLVLLFALAAEAAAAADAVSGRFTTKGKTFALKYAFAYTSEAKVVSIGKESVEKTIHVILSDKTFDAAALVGEAEPTRAVMRQAGAREASYLDIRLDTKGKLELLQWCPDYRTGLTWVGTPGADGVAKLELNERNAKHLVGRLETAPGAHLVDWTFDLRFDAPLIAAAR